VANFLAYANSGDYNGVAFHRSVTNSIVQGGAYKPVASPNKFKSIAKRPSPLNEPGISNIAKTIAMAKLGDDANSATSEFFFNLGDNASNLDNQNSGFTRVCAGLGPYLDHSANPRREAGPSLRLRVG